MPFGIINPSRWHWADTMLPLQGVFSWRCCTSVCYSCRPYISFTRGYCPWILFTMPFGIINPSRWHWADAMLPLQGVFSWRCCTSVCYGCRPYIPFTCGQRIGYNMHNILFNPTNINHYTITPNLS